MVYDTSRLVCFRNLDVWHADVEGIRSSDRGVRSHFLLIKAANSFSFSSLHSSFWKKPQNCRNLLVLCSSGKFFFKLCSAPGREVPLSVRNHDYYCQNIDCVGSREWSDPHYGFGQDQLRLSDLSRHFVLRLFSTLFLTGSGIFWYTCEKMSLKSPPWKFVGCGYLGCL